MKVYVLSIESRADYSSIESVTTDKAKADAWVERDSGNSYEYYAAEEFELE